MRGLRRRPTWRPLLLLALAAWGGDARAESSGWDLDLAGPGTGAHFEYVLTPAREGYRASVRVVDAEQNELWMHRWDMTGVDLRVMMEEEGRGSVGEWVARFFDNRPFGSETFSRRKLKEEDLIADFIRYSAGELRVAPEALKEAILAEDENLIFIYRSAWREELNILVYVPRYRRFVAYAGYGY